jgi:hypothetical protein
MDFVVNDTVGRRRDSKPYGVRRHAKTAKHKRVLDVVNRDAGRSDHILIKDCFDRYYSRSSGVTRTGVESAGLVHERSWPIHFGPGRVRFRYAANVLPQSRVVLVIKLPLIQPKYYTGQSHGTLYIWRPRRDETKTPSIRSWDQLAQMMAEADNLTTENQLANTVSTAFAASIGSWTVWPCERRALSRKQLTATSKTNVAGSTC